MKRRLPDEQHPVIKNWFLEKYPEVKAFGVTVDEAAEAKATDVPTLELAAAV